MISVNGSASDLSAVTGNAKSLQRVYARNGEAGEWVLVWPSETVRWFRSYTPQVAFVGGYTTGSADDPGTITGTLYDVDIWVGYDISEKWTDTVGLTGDHVGRLVYGSSFDSSRPVLAFSIGYEQGPSYRTKSYTIKAALNPFTAVDGSGQVLARRSDYDKYTKGGSNILYGTSSQIQIDASGNPTITFKGQPYYDWTKYPNMSFPAASDAYERTVTHNQASSGLRYGQDYWPKKS